jgi:mono/diheme cytochrome c family protein
MTPFLLALAACGQEKTDPAETDPWVLEETPQREGDAEDGLEYLLYGDYVGSGIPKDIFAQFFGTASSNPLGREGDAAGIPAPFNLFEAPNGVEVVGGLNCFGCHASRIGEDYIIGLGAAFSDFTRDESGGYSLVGTLIQNQFGEDSPEWEAFYRLGLTSETIGPYVVMPFAGINPAFSLEEAAATHRDPSSLEWIEGPGFQLPETPLGTDVPPWWNVKKKNALYYTALGRGDMARLTMQICVVGVWDTEHADDLDGHFPDVMAYLESLEAPEFPGEIDEVLALEGMVLFESHCSECHGTYGEVETYPNRLVPVEDVGTDPALALRHGENPAFLEWLQQSWFSDGENAAEFVSLPGYIAPPLDGVWATAPYLHNGSVANLAILLDSSRRPQRWTRDFDSVTYDLESVGWPYEETAEQEEASTYDGSLPGYGTTGHLYADSLLEAERVALLEYLKTL